MLEATFHDGVCFRKLVEAMKDLFGEVNFDANANGLACQAMDSSHVCLCSVELPKALFHDNYRCDRNLTMGLNMGILSKILKCAGNDETIRLSAADEDTSNVVLHFEKKDKERVSRFDMKLIDIDSEHLGIPDTEYDVEVKMPSAELTRICRDLSQFGDTVTIKCDKDSDSKRSRVTFACQGDSGTGNIVLYQSESVDENDKTQVSVKWPGSKVKKEEGEDDDDEDEACTIEHWTPVTQTYAMRFLIFFTKAGNLSDQVMLSIAQNLPLTTEYKIGSLEDGGSIRYFLAPKIDENEDEEHLDKDQEGEEEEQEQEQEQGQPKRNIINDDDEEE